MATKPDVINWAPIKTGNISFLRKNANTPIPKPAKKELLADESEIKIHSSKLKLSAFYENYANLNYKAQCHYRALCCSINMKHES